MISLGLILSEQDPGFDAGSSQMSFLSLDKMWFEKEIELRLK